MVRNDLGSAETSNKVKVNALRRPDFNVKLKPLEVTEGDQARLSVKIDALPKPTIQWYCGTTKITEGGRFEVVEEPDLYTLIINNVNKEDTATYKCEATNDAGKSTCRGELFVNERQYQPEFTSDEINVPLTLKPGDEMKIDVTIKGNPKPEVKWYKDGKALRNTTDCDLRSRGDTHSIKIYSTKPNDSGQYKCEARNKLGVTERSFDVKVEG